MSQIKVESYTVRQLKNKFNDQVFAIPEIQRQFIWNKKKITDLMDSIFRNYPIGISLIWKATYSQAINIRPNTKTIVPTFNHRSKYFDLIIDGQQRLSTMYGVLFGIDEKPEANSLINFNELYFNCDKNSEKRFVFSTRISSGESGYIPLSKLLSTTPSILKRQFKLKQWEAREALKCYNAFHAYKFYMLVVEGLAYDDVKEIFIRINTAGMTVSKADTLFAKASNVRLRDYMQDAKRGLKYGFDKISMDALQSTLGFAYGANRIGNSATDIILSNLERDKGNDSEFTKTWRKLQYGYEQAADFLVNTLKVKNIEMLPSQNIYSVLSYFFFLNQSQAKPNQIKEIKKWFWHTACGDRYSGAGFNRNIPEDIKFFKRLANNINSKYNILEKIQPLDFLKSNYKSSNAYFILLQNLKPKYLVNGIEMQTGKVSSNANRLDRHHIYPSALLRRKGINLKWINSIVNICYIEANENQSISDKHPKLYLAEYKSRRHFGKVLKSHLIPYGSQSPVWESNINLGFLEFINQRSKIILTEIEKMAGTKIFDKFDVIKRLS
jgi:hypothetical protein